MKRCVALCLALAVSTAASATGGIDVLSVYAGTWKTETTRLDTPHSKAGKESVTLRNDCWRSGDFYVCNQYVDGVSKALLVFVYNAKENSYASYPVVPGSDAAHAGKLLIAGNVWTFPWQASDKGKTTHFRVVNTFTSTDVIDFREEYSRDGKHWLPMASGQDRRQH